MFTDDFKIYKNELDTRLGNFPKNIFCTAVHKTDGKKMCVENRKY